MMGAFVYSPIVYSPPASYSHSDRRTDRGTRRNNLVLILHRRYLLRPTPRRIRIRTPTTLTAIHVHVHVHELNTSHPPGPDGHRHQLAAVPPSYIRAQMQDEPAGEHGRDGLQHERHRCRDEQSAVGQDHEEEELGSTEPYDTAQNIGLSAQSANDERVVISENDCPYVVTMVKYAKPEPTDEFQFPSW